MLFLRLNPEYWLISIILKRILKDFGLESLLRFLTIVEYRLYWFLVEASKTRQMPDLNLEAAIELGHAHLLSSLYKQISSNEFIALGLNPTIEIIDKKNGDKNRVRYVRGETATIKPVQRFLGCDCVGLNDANLLAMYGTLESSLSCLYQALYEITNEARFKSLSIEENGQAKQFSQELPFWLRLKWKIRKVLAWIYFLLNKEYTKSKIEKYISLCLLSKTVK